jgi:hypothetical protein
MKAWFEFFERTRFWELRPGFQNSGRPQSRSARHQCIVYLENGGEVTSSRTQRLRVYWYRPVTGGPSRKRRTTGRALQRFAADKTATGSSTFSATAAKHGES